MAKANFSCADCGATVVCEGRNRAEADRMAANFQSIGRLCSACREKSRQAENSRLAEQAKAVAQEAGWPALVGTEKQLQWAETIRVLMMEKAERALLCVLAIGRPIDQIKSKEDQDAAVGRMDDELTRMQISGEQCSVIKSETALLMRLLHLPVRVEAFVSLLRETTSASWWIDNREQSLAAIANNLLIDITKRVARDEAVIVPNEVVEEVKEEVLLKPGSDPATPAIAEIFITASGLRVTLPERRENFRVLMRDMGFSWQQNAWVRTLTFMQGNPKDRAAEVAHRVLGIGVMCRLHDKEAHELAVSGEFQPEVTRWITKLTSGDFAGWCCITWSKKDDLYAPARRISGSKYAKGAVVVPASSLLEAADFAKRYGFSLSDGVRKMVADHLAAVEKGTVIAEPKKPPAPLVDTGGAPKKLDVPSNPEIDDELLDRD